MSDCCIDCITLNVYMIRYQSRIISGNLMVSVENLASNESSGHWNFMEGCNTNFFLV